MEMEPIGWSVVLIGRWNPAILSPAGISKYLFKLPPDQKIQIAVPLDGVSGYLVSNPDETLVVHVEEERLQIEVPKCTFTTLAQAMQAAINAIEALPVTPISAAGFNLNFKTTTTCPELIAATDSCIDAEIAAQSYKIVGRSTGRSISFGEGKINFTVAGQDGGFHVNCNFHLATRELENAKAWLQMPIADIEQQIVKLGMILNIQMEENKNDEFHQSQS